MRLTFTISTERGGGSTEPGASSVNMSWSADSGLQHARIAFNINFVAVSPSVTDLLPLNGTSYDPNNTVNIRANVTDDISVDVVKVNVTKSNGTIQQSQ